MKSVLNNFTKPQIEKAKLIKALIFDVDGVLTDGGIIYSNDGEELKRFNVKDGQIIRHLKENQIIVGAITGRKSKLVQRRCEELKLDFIHQGVKDKSALLDDILKEYKLHPYEVAYIGDDIIDLKLVIRVGLGVVPEDGLPYVKAKADLVTRKNGGQGVVREVADLILASQGLLEDVLSKYID